MFVTKTFLLKKRYVEYDVLSKELAQKQDAGYSYSKEESDNKFASKKDVFNVINPDNFKTVDYQSILGKGNINISSFIYCNALPTSDIQENKIYVVKEFSDSSNYVQLFYKNNRWFILGVSTISRDELKDLF